MKKFTRNCTACAIALTLASMVMPLSAAAAYPERLVQMVLPVGVGGGTDLLARQLAKQLTEIWGQAVVVENRAGGGGIIAAQSVMRAAPDGYTIFLSHDGVITATPVLYKRPDYDPIKQFAPITQLATMSYLVVVNPAVPAKNIPELIGVMKEKSAKNESFGFATSALGSADHLSGEQFRIAAGVDMLVVPYKNSLPAMTDVIAGHLPFGFFTIPGTQPQVKSGNLRLIGITSSKRSKLFPDVPTVAETIPGFVTGAWYGLWVPVGTPAAIIDKIGNDARRVINSPEMAAYMLSNGFEPATSTPAEFAEFIRKESVKTAQVIKNANVKVE